MMSLKLVALWAITTTAEAKKPISFEFRFYMSIFNDKTGLQIQTPVKTSRPRTPLPSITFHKYDKLMLCV